MIPNQACQNLIKNYDAAIIKDPFEGQCFQSRSMEGMEQK